MTEPREPEQIRQDCARKLSEVNVSDQFTAILGCLLDEDWSSPRIEELFLSPDHCLVARVAGQVSHQTFLGAEKDLVRNIHGVAKVAELDGDELGYLLSEKKPINFGSFLYFAMQRWPECRVHWLVDEPIDSPSMWLSDEAWESVAERFTMGSRRKRGWPRPDIVTVCTSPGFISSRLARRLVRALRLAK